MMKSNHSQTFILFTLLLFCNCSTHAQEDKIIYRDSVLNYTICQSDLDKYLSYRNITDTLGKTKEYIKILKSATFRLKNKWLSSQKDKPLTYESAIAESEAWIAKRNLVDKVLVVKSQRKMFLLKGKKIIKTYAVALGPNPIGQKSMKAMAELPKAFTRLIGKNGTVQLFIRFTSPTQIK